MKRPRATEINSTADLLKFAGTEPNPSKHGDPVEFFLKEGKMKTGTRMHKFVRFTDGYERRLTHWLTHCWRTVKDTNSPSEALKGQPHNEDTVLQAARLTDVDGLYDWTKAEYVGHLGKGTEPKNGSYKLFSSELDRWNTPSCASDIRSGDVTPGWPPATRRGFANLAAWGFTELGIDDPAARNLRYKLLCPHGIVGTALRSSVNTGQHPIFCPDCKVQVYAARPDGPGGSAAVLKHAADDPSHAAHATTSHVVLFTATDVNGNVIRKIGKANDVHARYGSIEPDYVFETTEYQAYCFESEVIEHLRELVDLGIPKGDYTGHTECWYAGPSDSYESIRFYMEAIEHRYIAT